MSRSKWFFFVGLVAVLAVGTVVGARAVMGVSHAAFPPGLVEAGPYVPLPPPLDGPKRDTYDRASSLVDANPVDLTPVWWDDASQTVQVTAVTEAGRRALESTFHGDPTISSNPQATAGKADLESLMEGLTKVSVSGVDGAQFVATSEVDAKMDRAVLTVSEYRTALGDYLVANFPLDRIALRIDPNAGGAHPA